MSVRCRTDTRGYKLYFKNGKPWPKARVRSPEKIPCPPSERRKEMLKRAKKSPSVIPVYQADELSTGQERQLLHARIRSLEMELEEMKKERPSPALQSQERVMREELAELRAQVHRARTGWEECKRRACPNEEQFQTLLRDHQECLQNEQRCQTELSRVTAQLASAGEEMKVHLQAEMEAVREQLETEKRDHQLCQAQVQEMRARRREARSEGNEEEMYRCHQEIQRLKVEREQREVLVRSESLKLRTLQDQFNELQERYHKLEGEHLRLERVARDQAGQLASAGVNRDIDRERLLEKIRELESFIETSLKQHQNELTRRESEAQAKEEKLERDLRECQRVLATSQGKSQSEIARLRTELDSLHRRREEVREEKREAQSDRVDFSRDAQQILDQFNSQIRRVQDQLAECQTTSREREERVRQLEQQIAETQESRDITREKWMDEQKRLLDEISSRNTQIASLKEELDRAQRQKFSSEDKEQVQTVLAEVARLTNENEQYRQRLQNTADEMDGLKELAREARERAQEQFEKAVAELANCQGSLQERIEAEKSCQTMLQEQERAHLQRITELKEETERDLANAFTSQAGTEGWLNDCRLSLQQCREGSQALQERFQARIDQLQQELNACREKGLADLYAPALQPPKEEKKRFTPHPPTGPPPVRQSVRLSPEEEERERLELQKIEQEAHHRAPLTKQEEKVENEAMKKGGYVALIQRKLKNSPDLPPGLWAKCQAQLKEMAQFGDDIQESEPAIAWLAQHSGYYHKRIKWWVPYKAMFGKPMPKLLSKDERETVSRLLKEIGTFKLGKVFGFNVNVRMVLVKALRDLGFISEKIRTMLATPLTKQGCDKINKLSEEVEKIEQGYDQFTGLPKSLHAALEVLNEIYRNFAQITSETDQSDFNQILQKLSEALGSDFMGLAPSDDDNTDELAQRYMAQAQREQAEAEAGMRRLEPMIAALGAVQQRPTGRMARHTRHVIEKDGNIHQNFLESVEGITDEIPDRAKELMNQAQEGPGLLQLMVSPLAALDLQCPAQYTWNYNGTKEGGIREVVNWVADRIISGQKRFNWFLERSPLLQHAIDNRPEGERRLFPYRAFFGQNPPPLKESRKELETVEILEQHLDYLAACQGLIELAIRLILEDSCEKVKPEIDQLVQNLDELNDVFDRYRELHTEAQKRPRIRAPTNPRDLYWPPSSDPQGDFFGHQ